MSMTKAHEREIAGHPVGLYVLFFVELWERFSYYGMRAILTLFLAAAAIGENPGMGWSNSETLAFYGWYTMLVYVASIPGGIIADKIIGQKKAVWYGGWILVVGHTVLAIQQDWAFYAGLGLIIAGVGMLKPNISTMVGGLYKQGDDRRDKGFTIFYIGINIGAFVSSLVVGYIGENIGWHYGFGLAGIGMLLGMIVYQWGQKYLEGVGDYLGAADNPEKEAMNRSLTKVEKDRMLVMFLSFFLIIVFWGAFEQAGGLMNLYAKQKTDRFASMLTMNLIFILPIAIIGFKTLQSFFRKDGYFKYWGVLVSFIIIVFILMKKYVIVTDPFQIPASWFQSLNALFIILSILTNSSLQTIAIPVPSSSGW